MPVVSSSFRVLQNIESHTSLRKLCTMKIYHSADRDQTLSSMLGDNFFEEILHVLPRQVVLAVLCNYFCLVFAFATRVQKRVLFSFAWVAFLENV